MILMWLIVIGALFGLWLAFRGVSRKVDRLQRMVDDLVARPLPETHPDGQMVRAPAAEGAASAATPPVVRPMPLSPLHPIPSPFQRPVGRAEVRFPRAGIERPPAPLVPAPALRPSAAAPAPAVLAPAPASAEREIIAEPPALPGQEWEAVIGGSWLNKVGVLVFVIGIALFIGYSLTELGPAGRIAIGFAAALAMLLAGVVLERRELDTMYGRGLIGGGWAALYFTTYAAHGVEAARVIDSPVLATALLLAVAAGMIAHSIRYRSQVVTGLAYFVGFATLAITEMTGFALIASVPLAASLLIVARTFAWDEMAVMGVAVTYGAYLFSVAGRQPSWSGFLAGESVLTIYWLMFECFALLEVHGRGPDRRKDVLWSALFAMNSCAFIGVSMLQWTSALPIYVFLAAGGALFSIDSAVRGAIAPAHISRSGITLERLFEPGYEASITVGVILATAAIFEKFSGLAINIALLLEGELLLIAGLALGLGYLRMLAGAVLGVGAAKLLMFDQFAPRAASLAAFPMSDHTAVAVVTAAAMYLDRILSPDKWRGVFGCAAGLVLAALIGFEAPVDYVGLGWLLMGVFLFEAGLLTRADDFRMQGYAALAIGSLTILGVSIFPVEGASALGQKIALSAASILAYAIAAQAGRGTGIADEERATVRDLALGVGAAFLATLLWYLLPGPLLAIGWGVLALLQIEIGLVLGLEVLLSAGYATAVLAYGRTYFANFTTAGETAGISHRVLSVVPIIAIFYYLAERMRSEREGVAGEEASRPRQFLWGASLLVVVLMRFELGRVLAVVGWSGFGLALLLIGLWRGRRDLRWQSYAILALTFARGWATNFYVPGTLGGVPARLVTAGIVIALLYAAELVSPRIVEEHPCGGGRIAAAFDWVDHNARVVFAILATVLFTALVYNEASTRALTVAWAMEGVPLLVLGFALRERVLRLSGLALLGACVLKVFVYDLNNLETLARIVSFIVLGLLLLAVSFVYTRYYARLKRYL